MIAIEHLAKRFHVVASPAKTGLTGLVKLARRAAPRIVHAVRDVSFEAPDGRITGLLGPNGAGKTTTLRMLAGLITPDAGSLHVDGVDVARAPRDALARMGMLSDARGLYPRLTARENIVYYGRLQGLSRDAAQARASAVFMRSPWLKPSVRRSSSAVISNICARCSARAFAASAVMPCRRP